MARRMLAFSAFVFALTAAEVSAQVWQPPCGWECSREARAAARSVECGDEMTFRECADARRAAYEEALAACRDAACEGDEGPGPRPGFGCGLECFQSARAAWMECREAEGSWFECAAAYRDAVRECRLEAGCEVRERPVPCGVECVGAARDAFRACREAGDAGAEDGEAAERGDRVAECVAEFLTTLGSCREEAGCGAGDEEEDNEVIAELIAGLAEFERGDVNVDGRIDMSDPVGILGYLFLGQSIDACEDRADANDDGVVNLSDPTFILRHLFLGGPQLPAPSGGVGIDPTPDSLECAVF